MTEPVYSAKQEQGHTDVGASGPMPAVPVVSNAPDVAGVAGPAPTGTADPWPGRAAVKYAALDESAASYGSILSQAQQSPGTTVTTASTTGSDNSGAGPYGP